MMMMMMMQCTTQNTLCCLAVVEPLKFPLCYFGLTWQLEPLRITQCDEFSRCDHCLHFAGLTSSDCEVLWPLSRRCGEVIDVWGIIEPWVYFNFFCCVVCFRSLSLLVVFFGNEFLSTVTPVLTSRNLSTSVSDAVWLLAPSGRLQVAEILH